MTLVSEIIKGAYRELNVIPLGADPTANQTTEALAKLNTLILTTVGNEVGDELTDVNYGGDYDQSEYTNEWVPSNTRLMCNLTSALTLDLDPRPFDGQRLSLVDNGGNFATYNVTLDGNGRNIEGASTLTISTDDYTGQWMYRSDTGNWVKIEELEDTDEMPFPVEFDDYFTQMLAVRLNSRYGQAMSADGAMMLRRWRSAIRSRYRRRDLRMMTDPGLVRRDEYGYDDNFSIGRYSPW
jgi:hypothetical protein